VCLMCGYSGAPKTWYSVPGSAASDFEKVMQKAFPDLFEAQPDLLFQLVTMLSPEVVRDNGVPVCTTVQVPHSVHFPFCAFFSTLVMLSMVSGVVLFLSDWTRTPYNHIYLGIGIFASSALNFSRSFCLQFYVNYTI
jgi:hypothetical protein